MDLGRRDDVESWMYMLLEFSRGALPWRLLTDSAEVYQTKLSCRDKGRQELLAGLPSQFDEMLRLIDCWIYDTKPDYKTLRNHLSVIQKSQGITGREKFDWDEDTYSTTNTTHSPKHHSPPGSKDLLAYGTIEE